METGRVDDQSDECALGIARERSPGPGSRVGLKLNPRAATWEVLPGSASIYQNTRSLVET